jgi:hypothetical protein
MASLRATRSIAIRRVRGSRMASPSPPGEGDIADQHGYSSRIQKRMQYGGGPASAVIVRHPNGNHHYQWLSG